MSITPQRPARRPFPFWVRATVAAGLIVALVGGALSGWSVLSGGPDGVGAGAQTCTAAEQRRAELLVAAGLLETLPGGSRQSGGWTHCEDGDVTVARSYRTGLTVDRLVAHVQDAPYLASWQLEAFDPAVAERSGADSGAGFACLSHNLEDGTWAYALFFLDRAREDGTDLTIYLRSAPQDVRWCEAGSDARA
jgi:hypothetical protein